MNPGQVLDAVLAQLGWPAEPELGWRDERGSMVQSPGFQGEVRLGQDSVTILIKRRWFSVTLELGRGRRDRCEVNWSAVGAQPPEEAAGFARELLTSAVTLRAAEAQLREVFTGRWARTQVAAMADHYRANEARWGRST